MITIDKVAQFFSLTKLLSNILCEVAETMSWKNLSQGYTQVKQSSQYKFTLTQTRIKQKA